MVVQDIVHSCVNEHVAEAALASIGGAFARRVRDAAGQRGVRPGTFAADAVRRFRSSARPAEFEALQRAVAHDDQPLLAGLRMIVETDLPSGT